MSDLTMVRGDTQIINLTVTNSDGSTYDLIGATLIMTAKHGYTDLDSAAVFQITQAVSGLPVVTILPSMTSSLPPFSVLVYDIQLTEADGQVTTLQNGKLVVTADVTVGAGGSPSSLDVFIDGTGPYFDPTLTGGAGVFVDGTGPYLDTTQTGGLTIQVDGTGPFVTVP